MCVVRQLESLTYILMSKAKNYVITCLQLIYTGLLEVAILLMAYSVEYVF